MKTVESVELVESVEPVGFAPGSALDAEQGFQEVMYLCGVIPSAGEIVQSHGLPLEVPD